MSQRSRRTLIAASALSAAALVALSWQPVPVTQSGPHAIAGGHAASTAGAPVAAPGDLATMPAAHRTSAAVADRPAYVADQLLIGVAPGVDLAGLAAEHGLRLAQPAGPSGLGALAIDPADAESLTAALSADPRVRHIGPMGAIYATGKGGGGGGGKRKASTTTTSTDSTAPDGAGDTATAYVALQTHLATMNVPADAPGDIGTVVVAVLDTGVAYIAEELPDGNTSVVAPTLATNPIVAPWDFVNDDGKAADDNQHGTHIASLIGSQGVVRGVAPGVALMPIKVLDENKTGTELDLIDGVAHAALHGADVINMSLGFAPGYAPSGPLQGVLSKAAETGAILVGATGNDSMDQISWPAASPAVIAVASVDSEGIDLAWYGNGNAAVEILAPGGDLSVDLDGNGYPDGALAETIAYQDPSATGLYFAEGTSQATAMVSGAVARFLASGVEPASARQAVMLYAERLGTLGQGHGAGIVDVANTELSAPNAPPVKGYSVGDIHVAMLPTLRDLGDAGFRADAQLYAMDSKGDPLVGVQLWAHFGGSADSVASCWTTSTGCVVQGAPTAAKDPLFTVVVEGAADKYGTPLGAPTAAFFASDALEVLAAALAVDAPDALPAFYVEAHVDTDGETTAEHYVAVNSGTGLLSSPMGIVFSPGAVAMSATVSPVSLDLDGTGLLSSPMGFQPALLLNFGTGLLSSPMGFQLITLNGTGLLSSPMGFTASAMLEPNSYPTVSVIDPVFSGEPVLLATGVIDSPFASGTELDALVTDGGWVSASGAGAASEVLSSTSASSVPSTVVGVQQPVPLVP